MDYTRQPIIETVITPKEGCKLVVRSSKAIGQEEFFVDAVEVVSFGNTFFFRSTERPKPFLVPTSDYEVLEVRETRVVLKNVPPPSRGNAAPKESQRSQKPAEVDSTAESQEEKRPVESRRERSRRRRRRRGNTAEREEVESTEAKGEEPSQGNEEQKEEKKESSPKEQKRRRIERTPTENSSLEAPPVEEYRPLVPPPSTLIAESIDRYREAEDFRGAFFDHTEEGVQQEAVEAVEQPASELPETVENSPSLQPQAELQPAEEEESR